MTEMFTIALAISAILQQQIRNSVTSMYCFCIAISLNLCFVDRILFSLVESGKLCLPTSSDLGLGVLQKLRNMAHFYNLEIMLFGPIFLSYVNSAHKVIFSILVKIQHPYVYETRNPPHIFRAPQYTTI